MSGMENNFSLVGCMEEVPDPRAPYNQKHKLLDIIVIAVTAILCGMDTWNEIEDWAKSKREWLGSFLELPGGIPSHDSINRVFQINPVSCPDTDTLTFQGMTIDNLNRLVFMNDVQVELTGKEFDLLSFLAANKGKVFTKKQIYTHVWEEEYAFDDSNIMSFISKLRKKIEPDPEHPFYILTVRGVGYRFNREA